MRPFSPRFLRAALLSAALGLAACAAPCDHGEGVAVPVTMRGNTPLVPVEVNGNRVPFVLDTGASQTVILAEGARRLRLQTDRLRSGTSTGIGGVSRERNALVAGLRFGAHDLRNLTVPVAAHSAAVPAAGLLGGDVLGAAELDLDLPAGRVTLHDRRRCRLGALPWEGGVRSVPFEQGPAGLIVIRAEVNGRPVRALFDTGAALTVMDRGLASAIGAEAALAGLPRATLHGVGTEGVEAHLLPDAALRVAGEAVPLRRLGLTAWPNRPFDLILGQDYIAPRRFWVSYAERRLYVRDAATGTPAAPPAPAAR